MPVGVPVTTMRRLKVPAAPVRSTPSWPSEWFAVALPEGVSEIAAPPGVAANWNVSADLRRT